MGMRHMSLRLSKQLQNLIHLNQGQVKFHITPKLYYFLSLYSFDEKKEWRKKERESGKKGNSNLLPKH